MRARMAAALAAKGNDTLVAGIAAYSTLGHFADPVLNTMMRYGDLELVSMLFHELAHQLIYIKDDTVFNESFAMTVEEEGLAPLAEARGRGSRAAGIPRAARGRTGNRKHAFRGARRTRSAVSRAAGCRGHARAQT